MRCTLDPAISVSKTELLQLLDDAETELSRLRPEDADDEPTELECRYGAMAVRLGPAGVFSE